MGGQNRRAPERDTVAAALDRRDSPRVPIRILVRELAVGGSFEERDGNLGLGGVFYSGSHPPQGTHVEIRLLLPGARGQVPAVGEIVRVSRERGVFGAHVQFLELPVASELAIARFLERATR